MLEWSSGLYSVESVCVCHSRFSFLLPPPPHTPSTSLPSFFLFFKKGKGLHAQSVHSLNFMLSKNPPFNLRSLCLGYYLQSLSLFFLLHFLLANYPTFSSVYLVDAHAPLLYSAGSDFQSSEY